MKQNIARESRGSTFESRRITLVQEQTPEMGKKSEVSHGPLTHLFLAILSGVRDLASAKGM